MAEVTIEKLASDVGTTVDRLVQQFADAGIPKQTGQMVSEEEKKSILAWLCLALSRRSLVTFTATFMVSSGLAL